METQPILTKSYTNRILFNKLNDYFKDNIKLSNICNWYLLIITKDDMFYCINIEDENISSYIINNDKSVIDEMIIKDLCYKQINDLYVCYGKYFEYYCFARNEYNIYYYDIKYGVMKEYICEEKVVDICCGDKHSILLTQSGKVYEYLLSDYERECSEKYIYSELKSLKSYSVENEKIVMISCGSLHSLALTESGRVFGWGHNSVGQLGVEVEHSSEPIIIELNGLKIKKISCGEFHSLLLSCDGHIYAFGSNQFGVVGNGTRDKERFPIKLELNNKFIDIASHPFYFISMSQSIDGIYYVWGLFQLKSVLSPQSTKYESFEDILRANNSADNIKTFEKLIEFNDWFVRSDFYSTNFEEIKKLGFGSFGSVFKVKRWGEESRVYSAIKRIELSPLVDINEIIREYLNVFVINKDVKHVYLVEHFDAWFEKNVPNQSEISHLYIQMELCDKTLEDVINEFDKELHLKTNGTLTAVGYYITSNIFLQILEGVNCLHKQNLIHRDLKPANILLKKLYQKEFCVKIADFGLLAIHKYSGQSHTADRGTIKYMAPEAESTGEYDTKADIYSLAVIFKELIDFETDEKEVFKRSGSLSLYDLKYNAAVDIYHDMSAVSHKRSNCEEILKKRNLWVLNGSEFEINDELKKIIDSKESESELTIYSMLRPKMISDKAIKSV
jgi:hypothetical protein